MRVDLHGLVLAYDSAGSGRPLLLIHGYPLSRRLWQPQLDELGDAAWLIAPDLRGHGESNSAPPPYSMELLADDCLELLDALNASEPAVVAGLSMGGYVALALYRKYPERVAGLILAATRAGADSPEGRANRAKSAVLAQEKGPAAIAEAMLPKMLAPHTHQANPSLAERVRHMMAGTSVEGLVGDLQGMAARPDASALLDQINVPVLVIHGLEDQLIPPSEAEAMNLRLKRGRLQLIPGAGHLVNMEQPAEFNAQVRTYLDAL